MNRCGVTKSMSSAILFVLVLLLPSSASADGQSRIFLAIIQGALNLMPTDDPCVFRNIDETARGLATHMGRITAKTDESLDFCSSEPDVVVNGQFVLENADGDRLSCTYQTSAMANPESMQIRGQGTYECSDGAGRLTFCSGEGVISARGSLNTVEVDLALLGKLNCNSWED